MSRSSLAEQVNEAYERVLASDVHYRFVIDTSTLGGHPSEALVRCDLRKDASVQLGPSSPRRQNERFRDAGHGSRSRPASHCGDLLLARGVQARVMGILGHSQISASKPLLTTFLTVGSWLPGIGLPQQVAGIQAPFVTMIG